jgi:hypothetical protein
MSTPESCCTFWVCLHKMTYNEALSPTRWQYQSKVKVAEFHNSNFFCKEKNALAFNWDRFCHLVLCLQLIPFHYNHYFDDGCLIEIAVMAF